MAAVGDQRASPGAACPTCKSRPERATSPIRVRRGRPLPPRAEETRPASRRAGHTFGRRTFLSLLLLSLALDLRAEAHHNRRDDNAEESFMSAEARLKQLGITLPNVPAPVANYLPYRIAGNLLFLAGQGPRDANGNLLTGKVGGDVSVEEGYKRARIIGLQLLSATRQALGSLDRVDTVLKMLC